MHSQSRQISLPARLEEVLLYQCLRDAYTYNFMFINHVQMYKMSKTFINSNITVNKWKKSKHKEFLGIPTYWGSGLAENNGTRYELKFD